MAPPPPPSGAFPGVPPAAGGAPTPTRTSSILRLPRGQTRVGPYEVLAELGQGGAGVVLRARGPDGREVAVKLLRALEGDAAERFARERELQAELGAAEGFVPLLDHGEGPSGPYLVMPYLSGGTLRDRLRRGPLPVDQAVALVGALAAALGRAHARGIVHRDLKPENVLFAADGAPLVADLGLAKRKDVKASGLSLSVSGEFRGTAGYMAPEQMKDAKGVGPPADVFALGAILYECLAGEPAFSGDSVVAVVDRVDTGKVVPLARRCPEAPPWLVRVVGRCLARDPGARFADGGRLAAALAAGPDGDPGPAPRATSSALLLAVGAALGLLAGVPLGAAWARRQANAAAPPPAAATEAGPAPASVTAAPPPATEAGPASPSATEAEPAPPSATEAEPAPPSTTEAPPDAPPPWPFAGRAGDPALGLAVLDRDLGRLTHLALVTRFGSPRFRHTAAINAVACAAGAEVVVAGDDHGQVRTWHRAAGAAVRAPVLTGAAPVRAVAVSPDARRTAWIGADGKPRTRDAAGGVIDLEGHEGQALCVVWGAEPAVLATGGQDGFLYRWDLEARGVTGRIQHPVPVTAAAFSADGKVIVTGTADGTLQAFEDRPDVKQFQVLGRLEGGKGAVRALAISPDRATVAGLVDGHGLCLWDLTAKAGKIFGDVVNTAPRAVAFTSDGARLVAVDAREVVVWDVARGLIAARKAVKDGVRAAAVVPGAAAVVILCTDRSGGLSVVDLDRDEVQGGAGHLGAVTGLAERGRAVWTSGVDGAVFRWDEPERPVRALDRAGWATGVDLSPDGRLVAATWWTPDQRDGALVVAAAADPAQRRLSADGGVGYLVARFAADPQRLVAATDAGALEEVDLARGPEGVRRWLAHARRASDLCWLPDGRLLSRGLEDDAAGSLAAWRLPDDVPLARAPAPRARLAGALAVVPGGGALAVVGGPDGDLRWVDLDLGHEVRAVTDAHDGHPVLAVAVAPDGALGASGGFDRTLRLWDPRDGRLLEQVRLEGSADVVTALRFCQDGRGLLVGFASGVVVRLAPRP